MQPLSVIPLSYWFFDESLWLLEAPTHFLHHISLGSSPSAWCWGSALRSQWCTNDMVAQRCSNLEFLHGYKHIAKNNYNNKKKALGNVFVQKSLFLRDCIHAVPLCLHCYCGIPASPSAFKAEVCFSIAALHLTFPWLVFKAFHCLCSYVWRTSYLEACTACKGADLGWNHLV